MSSRGGSRALFFSIVAIAVLMASPISAQASSQTDVNKALDRIMEVPDGPPGISMLIVKNGKAQHFWRGYGDLSNKTRPRKNDHFRIASVAKAFSGAVALRLVARRKLRVNTRVGQLIPGQLPLARDVTLGQALHHTGGLPEYIRSQGFITQITDNPLGYVSPQKILSWVRDQELTHAPGTKYEYSDTDNIAVGLMAEKAARTPYVRQIRQGLGPITGGLWSTYMPNSAAMPRPYMRGYDIEEGNPPEDISSVINPSGAWASGGLVSTLPNLSRFFRTYVSGGFFGKGKRARVIMRTQRSWRPGESQPAGPGRNMAGLGLFRYTTTCGSVFGHTGSFPGYRVFVASSADGKRSIAFVANAQILKDTPNNPNAPRISTLIRRAQTTAVCHALR